MPRLYILAAALLFSTGGVAIKGNSLTPWQVASFRSLVAAIALAVMLPGARKNWTWHHALAAIAYAGTLVSFVAATKLTTAANAIFLQSTAPGYLIFLSPILLKEKLRRSDFLVLSGVSLGIALFFVSTEPARATAPDPVTGNIIAAISGLVWALTVIGMRWLSREDTTGNAAMATAIIGNIFAFFGALPMALPMDSFSLQDGATLVYLGVFQIGLAYYCLSKALARIPAFEAATLLLVEPALNPVWTWLVLGERPAALAIAGGAVILTSTLLNTWWQTTRVRPSGAA